MTDVAPSLSLDELTAAYRGLYLIRRFEERTAELFASGVITGTAHSCVGQEAIAVGAGSGPAAAATTSSAITAATDT